MKPLVLFLVSMLVAAGGIAKQRIISLAPHTTELVYALDAGEQLVAVSDFSDYPNQAAKLPTVANHNGVDFEQILRLKPDLILAWQGGNKPQDLARLTSLGFSLFYSSPKTPLDIAIEIEQLGQRLGKQEKANLLSKNFRHRLARIKQEFSGRDPVKVFYYMWPKPLMSVGGGAWASQLLTLCGATNSFADISTDYPQVSVEQVIQHKPQKLVAAMKISQQEAESFWSPYQSLLSADIVVVNPDLLHRFTPRLLIGLEQLCVTVHETE